MNRARRKSALFLLFALLALFFATAFVQASAQPDAKARDPLGRKTDCCRPSSSRDKRHGIFSTG
jgi:hypothetical protein